MEERSVNNEIRNFVAKNIINNFLKNGDKFYEKEFLINKFRVNPSYVDKTYQRLLDEDLIEAKSDYYYMKIDENKRSALIVEFANGYLNEFLKNMNSIGISNEGVYDFISLRMSANG
ncbi:MAG: hypothetical protein E6073_07255 [Anaerococcus vaginalis]|nr:hypothetical protein [Anaerococcus vaginalis]MDU7163550.1 hypothetical protein [Anaerococcus vaginalis]